MENIRIIGTSHVAKASMEEVRNAILKDKPDILALELDQGRLHSLLHENKPKGRVPISQIGFKGYLFYLIGSWMQKKIGRMIGVLPGAEMKLAIKLAHRHDIRVALIDRDIRVTLKRFSQSIGWKEKWHLAADLIKGLLFGEREMKKLGVDKLDLSKVPDEEIIQKLITQVKDRYPGTYSSLIEERNQIMASNILKLVMQEPDKKILVIVGAGHKQAIEEELETAQSMEMAVAS